MKPCCIALVAVAHLERGRWTIDRKAICYCPFCGWSLTGLEPRPVAGVGAASSRLLQRFRAARKDLGQLHIELDELLQVLERIPEPGEPR